MKRIIAIDFGTSNSSVGYLEAGESTIIKNSKGSLYTPSVIALNEQGQFIFGDEAKAIAYIYPEKTISNIKRKLGSTESIRLGNKSYLAQELIAKILYKLKRQEFVDKHKDKYYGHDDDIFSF